MDPQWWSTSLWRERYKLLWSFMCPLCKEQRRVPLRSRPGAWEVFQVSLTSFIFMLLFWPLFHWKGVVSFVPFWMVFEIFYRWRMRVVLYCRKCGFDPYLFMIDHKLARKEVDTFWRKKLAEKGIPYPEKKPAQRPPQGIMQPALDEKAQPSFSLKNSP